MIRRRSATDAKNASKRRRAALLEQNELLLRLTKRPRRQRPNKRTRATVPCDALEQIGVQLFVASVGGFVAPEGCFTHLQNRTLRVGF